MKLTMLTAIAIVLAAPAFTQEAESSDLQDGMIVDMTADGPKVTDQIAPTPEELVAEITEKTGGLITPEAAIVEPGDTLVAEPLVARSDGAGAVMPVTADEDPFEAAAPDETALEADAAAMAAEDAITDGAAAAIAAGDALLEELDMMDAIEAGDATQADLEAAEAATAAAIAASDAATQTAEAAMADAEAAKLDAKMAELDTTIAKVEAEVDAMTKDDADEEITEDSQRLLDEQADALMAEADALLDETDAMLEDIGEMVTDAPSADVTTDDLNSAQISEMAASQSASVIPGVSLEIDVKDMADSGSAHIMVTGADVTQTETPDGTTRLIRVTGANGQTTLVTITNE